MAYRSDSIIIPGFFDRSALLGKTSSSNPSIFFKKIRKGRFLCQKLALSQKSFRGKICPMAYRSRFNHYTYSF